ncbi:uncharacterized protein LOC121420008 isoform X1 [Lytechinus variegatus]|uniref:uncharacterized protein LOC121420008 isoform X1 n=1 Tax=Lytechinus variegatus TaxID=7654 RepID=UPI001BB181E9|nr:uncharacterized protein LOC121420008 isoform X1 [Lytechinus variegatus]
MHNLFLPLVIMLMFKFIFFLSRSSHPARPNVHVYGDSLLRDIKLDIDDINFSVYCQPGATVERLTQFIKNNVNTGICKCVADVEIVILHVGTNNLNFDVWDWIEKKYKHLYSTVRELYPCATIIFSGIAPRWDRQDLYEASVFFNLKLNNFTARTQLCEFIESPDCFSIDDRCHRWDGLHLTSRGKTLLAEAFVKKVRKVIFPCQPTSYIPKELKRLYTPKRKRRKSDGEEQKELNNYKGEEKKQHQEWKLQERLKKKTHCCNKKKWSVDWDENVIPRRRARPPTPPVLPPDRHIPEMRCNMLIPYEHVAKHKETQGFSSVPSVKLPQPTSRYVGRKKKGKAKRRRDRATKKRKKRKKRTNPWNVVCSTDSLFSVTPPSTSEKLTAHQSPHVSSTAHVHTPFLQYISCSDDPDGPVLSSNMQLDSEILHLQARFVIILVCVLIQQLG